MQYAPGKGKHTRIFRNNPQNKSILYNIYINIVDPGVSGFCALPAMSLMGCEVSNLHRAQSVIVSTAS